jgi:hypothetical protein
MSANVERKRDANRKREARAAEREVLIPPCEDRERRELLEACDEEWLRYYFAPESESPAPFWYDFTSQQQEMIAAIRSAILFGGDQAIAASRGEGKTTYFERTLLKYTLQGVCRFSVLFAATGGAAEDSLESIKTEIETNKRLLADYPEVCIPVLALENTPNRAHFQIVTGARHDNGEAYSCAHSRFSWCGQQIYLPNVPGSPSAAAIIATRGLDSAVRGLKKKGRRVDVAGIDDPDTEETARSPDQARKLELRIDRAIAGLGGQQRSIARVMLTTLQSRISVSYKFTDPEQKQSWKGRRFRFLITPPQRTDLWEEYCQMRQMDQQSGDEHGRRAHAFYVDNREAMEAGAEVANLNRYDSQPLPDGTQKEVSALQRYYNEVARIGAEAVATEYDNDPPEESGPVESGITPTRIQRQLSGFARKIIPPGCTIVSQGIDCRKVALHWVVRAWRPDGLACYTIDYGVHEVHGTSVGVDEGVDLALKRAIKARIEESKSADYETSTGEIRKIDLTLVDAGWQTNAVYAACSESGLGVMPVMGFGKSSGCTQANFHDIYRTTIDKKPGDGWFLSRKGKLWLVCADADRWKEWEHARWMTAANNPGAMLLFGENSANERLSIDEKSHHSYARHICNEVEVEEPHKGGLRRRFHAKSDNTHWLDASYYATVAAHIKGIRVIKSARDVAATEPAKPGGGWFDAQKMKKAG